MGALDRRKKENMTPSEEEHYEKHEVIAAIKAQFSILGNRRFLTPYWRNQRKNCTIVEKGFCRPATHAYYKLMGGAAAGLKIKKWLSATNPNDGHFWIEDREGHRVDLTEGQYGGRFQHYGAGENVARGHAAKFTEAVRSYLQNTRRAKTLEKTP
jgi:hypothetical protein